MKSLSSTHTVAQRVQQAWKFSVKFPLVCVNMRTQSFLLVSSETGGGADFSPERFDHASLRPVSLSSGLVLSMHLVVVVWVFSPHAGWMQVLRWRTLISVVCVCVCVQSRLMQLCINQDHPSPHTLLSEGDEAFAPRFHAHEPETNSHWNRPRTK